jgi:hypothetical protein
MAANTRTEYNTCKACREPIRQLSVSTPLGKLKSRTTSHVRQVRDPDQRCKYDHGPGLGSLALVKFPGNT